ncbi:MAG TPA: HD domain-containing phosphohydrolase [Polyangiaceae bacterium]|nr:HD domain-containing phosphohydrolase [Polyangiaceae bacterium]
MPAQAPNGRIRLAELVAALSLGIDLGFGQPMEHVLRQCLIALRLAERVGLDEEARSVVYYTALLTSVGCHSDAHEQAKWFGDDIEMKSHKYDPAFQAGGFRAAVAGLRSIGAGHPPLHRFRVGLEFLISGHQEVDGMIARHSRLAKSFAEQLGLSQAVANAVGSAYEFWDGRGWPGTLSGAEIPIAARIASLAEYGEVAHRVGGVRGLVHFTECGSGKQFDPALCGLVKEHAEGIVEGIDSVRAWPRVIEQEPALAVVLSDDQCDAVLLAIANFIDLKSPYTLGHSAAVAELAAAAGSSLGLSAADVRALRRAGLVHAFGRLGISNSIWDKPGPLGAGEWERVRMQPYITDRMLNQSAALAPLVPIVALYRERLDGSGYPRGLIGASISRPGRILAAADVYQALLEARPHRGAHPPEEAARTLRDEARAGKLDHEIVEAVLSAAGHRTRARRDGPAGLTAREVEVLRLLARGLSTKEIAKKLVVSPKTAANHIEHIYSKIDAKNRVAASLFAVEHGLLPEG